MTARQAADRRVSRVALRYPDRRLGFPRRRAAMTGPRAAYHRLLRSYRRRPLAIGVVLVAVVALNLADIGLTMALLERGATELNPVVAALLGIGPAVAVAAKAVLGVAVAGALWALRRYRRALEVSLLVAAILASVVAYQAVGLLVA